MNSIMTVRGADAQILRIALIMLIISSIISTFALLRLIGVSNVVYIGLMISRAMDLLLISIFFIVWKGSIRLNYIDIALLIVALYPAAIGLSRAQLSITFLNDLLTYYAFIFKVIVFKNALSSLYQKIHPDNFFKPFCQKLVIISLVIGFLALFMAQLFFRAGIQHYYQAPFEITLATSIVTVNNQVSFIMLFLMIAILSGKRMIFVSLIAVLSIAFFRSNKLKRKAIQYLTISSLPILAFFVLFFMSSSSISANEIAAFDKISYTYRIVVEAFNSLTWHEFFLMLDKARYVEIYSLWNALSNVDLIFGAGYGFRYELVAIFDNVEVDRFGTVSNCHFSPLGIISKFGVIGFIFWTIYVFAGLRSVIVGWKSSWFRYACGLALCILLIQSLFAYGFFSNLFTPFVLAVATTPLLPHRNLGTSGNAL